VGRILVTVLAGATGGLAAAGAAAAHGAPDEPISRTAACAPGGPYETAAVCRAALAASERTAFDDWDYVRVAGVAGRDREVVPDGALCSGGAPGFAGLDLPRADWPATELAAGAELTFTYRTTIPHLGTFRMYLTRDRYDPERPLAWSDLDDEPFLTATDPEVADGAYRMPGRLPSGRTGRHLILTVWQNSDTPDTYYSCTDVVLDEPASAPTAAIQSVRPTEAGPAEASATEDSVAVGSGTVALATGGAAVALAGGVAVVATVARRRRGRDGAAARPRSGSHRLR
jgi:chitin-binding protein